MKLLKTAWLPNFRLNLKIKTKSSYTVVSDSFQSISPRHTRRWNRNKMQFSNFFCIVSDNRSFLAACCSSRNVLRQIKKNKINHISKAWGENYHMAFVIVFDESLQLLSKSSRRNGETFNLRLATSDSLAAFVLLSLQKGKIESLLALIEQQSREISLSFSIKKTFRDSDPTGLDRKL